MHQNGEAMHQVDIFFHFFFFNLELPSFQNIWYDYSAAMHSAYTFSQRRQKGAVEIECCFSSFFQKKCERYWPESKDDVFVCEPFTIYYVRNTSSLAHSTVPVLVIYLHSHAHIFSVFTQYLKHKSRTTVRYKKHISFFHNVTMFS